VAAQDTTFPLLAPFLHRLQSQSIGEFPFLSRKDLVFFLLSFILELGLIFLNLISVFLLLSFLKPLHEGGAFLQP